MKMVQWRLDHILYTSPSLQPISFWSTLEADLESSITGLPNHVCPSDHLPIAALFQVDHTGFQMVAEADKETLVCRLRSLTKRRTDELMEIEKGLNEQLAEIESRLTQQKEKKKRGPPPQEIMNFMRNKREQIRALKLRQRMEREEVVQGLGPLERLAIQEKLGCSARQWVERGS